MYFAAKNKPEGFSHEMYVQVLPEDDGKESAIDTLAQLDPQALLVLQVGGHLQVCSH